jgi:selenoprotein W-related protein
VRDVETRLIEGSGGTLDVVLDGKLLFSKKKAGRWPEASEIVAMIPDGKT